MKNKKTIIFLLLFMMLLFSSKNISAYYITFDDSMTAGYYVENSTFKRIGGITSHYLDQGNTVQNAVYYSQQVNVLSQTCNENTKIVTWAVTNNDKSGFVRKSVADIARDYEKNHPGWKVLGGINADQYYTKHGEMGHVDGSDYFYPQPYGPFIADYEKWFSISAKPYGGNGTYIAGFLNDGSSDQIVEGYTNWENTSSKSVRIAGLFLSVFDDDELIGKIKIDRFNEDPLEGESSLFSPFYQGLTIPNVNVAGNLYVVENADLAYVSNSLTYTYKSLYDQKNINNAQNAFFGKGSVSLITNSAQLTKGDFAISSNNVEIDALLKIGSNIVVQYEYEGIMNEVESATAYHTIMRQDNKDKNSTSSYNTRQYPRSIFGRNASGTMFLITIDGSQGVKGMYGTNQYESNAVLKHYGLVEAYQMDGGGSTTMIVRDNSDFKVVNSPSDGTSRSVLTAMLFVTRDSIVESSQVDAANDSVTINARVAKTFERNIKDIYIEIDSQLNKVEDQMVTITNLQADTQYKYRIYLEDDNGISKTDFFGVVTTAKKVPIFKICPYSKENNKFIFTPVFEDESAITNLKLIIDENIYELDDGEFIVESFSDDSIIILSYSYQLSSYNQEVVVQFLNPQYYTTIFFEIIYGFEDDFIRDIY